MGKDNDGVVGTITSTIKFICKFPAAKMLMILVFISIWAFLGIEYLLLSKENRILPESFHPQHTDSLEVR